MKKLAFIFCLMFSLKGFANEKSEVLIKEKGSCVFTLLCYNEKNIVTSTSTGFFIDKSGIALTNIHVFKEAHRAKVKTLDGKVYEVERLLDYDPNLDVAKIQIKKQGNVFPALKISEKIPEPGEEIYALAGEDGQDGKVSKGTVASLNTIKNFGTYYQLSPSMYLAGGLPVFNVEGEVIAITAFNKASDSGVISNTNYAVNISNSNNLNKELNVKFEKSYKEILYGDFVASYIMSLIANDHLAAIRACDKQIEEKPYAWLAYHYRGFSKLELKKFSDAEQDIKRAVNLNKTNQFKEMEYFALGKIYKRAKMYAEAKDAYMKALELSPRNANCYCEISALTEESLGQSNSSVEDAYMKAIAIDPKSCPFGFRAIALNSLAQQQYEKAIEFFSRALEIETEKKGFIISYFNRGNAYYESKNYEEAIDDFEECLKLLPDDYESCLSIGMCYLKLNKKAQACEAYQKAKKIVDTYKLGAEAKSMVSNAIQMHCK